MPRDHFDISDKSHDYNYSSRTGFPNDGRPIPQRDRAAHSQHVAQMFLAAKQENRQYRETAQLSSAPEGYYLKIQNQQGKDLALKNLDSRQIGHLINIREQGAGAEKMIEATLFLKEQKNELLQRTSLATRN